MVYLALHNGKKKQAQLGWLGKQWGVWCRSLFVARAPESHRIPSVCAKQVRRSLRRYSQAVRRSKTLAPLPVAPLHQGDCLRVVTGLLVSRLVSFYVSLWNQRRATEPF